MGISLQKNCNKPCLVLNYIDKLLILVSAGTGCVPISAFGLLIGISFGTPNASIGLWVYVICAITKNNRSLIKKIKEKHEKIILLSRTKFNTLYILFSKALIHPQFFYEKFHSVHVVFKE